jgi:succinate dehydrogenase flavin-adding protein (antitoxin of CptAB toxin-antitoxin module)
LAQINLLEVSDGFAKNLLDSTWTKRRVETQDFFLSQTWIDTYLKHWPVSDCFAAVECKGLILAVLSIGHRNSRLAKRYNSLGFNVSSSKELVSATLETNGLIGTNGEHLISQFSDILGLLSKSDEWQELRIDGLLKSEAISVQRIAKEHGFLSHVHSEQLTYAVDLDVIRNQFNGKYLDSLSSNTRSQLRKALKTARQDLGEVVLDQSSTENESLDWLEELAKLHQARWNVGEVREGFALERFFDFQRDLVKSSGNANELQMLRLSAGGKPLAYLYNFAFKDSCSFYMSGIDYDQTTKYRPGMLAHWYAIERNLSSQLAKYDFLAGTNRYKESLANTQNTRISVILRKPNLLFRIEDALRQYKRNRASV